MFQLDLEYIQSCTAQQLIKNQVSLTLRSANTVTRLVDVKRAILNLTKSPREEYARVIELRMLWNAWKSLRHSIFSYCVDLKIGKMSGEGIATKTLCTHPVSVNNQILATTSKEKKWSGNNRWLSAYLHIAYCSHRPHPYVNLYRICRQWSRVLVSSGPIAPNLISRRLPLNRYTEKRDFGRVLLTIPIYRWHASRLNHAWPQELCDVTNMVSIRWNSGTDRFLNFFSEGKRAESWRLNRLIRRSKSIDCNYKRAF